MLPPRRACRPHVCIPPARTGLASPSGGARSGATATRSLRPSALPRHACRLLSARARLAAAARRVAPRHRVAARALARRLRALYVQVCCLATRAGCRAPAQGSQRRHVVWLRSTEWWRALQHDGYALSTFRCVASPRVQAAERVRAGQRAAALRVAHVHRRRLMRRGGELASGSPRCVVARHAQALRARGGERRAVPPAYRRVINCSFVCKLCLRASSGARLHAANGMRGVSGAMLHNLPVSIRTRHVRR